MGTGQIYRTLPPPIVHTADIRPIELIVKLFHNLILYLLLIFVCLLPKLTPGNTGGLTTWWISIPEIERYKTVPVWRNHERWCEPSDVPQDTSCTHVSWHIRRWYLTWVQTPRWWSGLILSLAWFLIFLSWCKYSVFLSKKVSTSPVNVSTSYVLGVYFLASRHPF